MDLPEIVSGLRIRQMTPFGNMHVKITVNPRSECELEVFAQLGKGGDVANSDLEAICRLISLWLRSGGGLRQVVKQLDGIGSTLQIPTRAGRITSLADGLAASLKKYTRAKERFGLRALLLGEADLAALDAPIAPARAPAAEPVGAVANGGHAHSDGGGPANGGGQGGSSPGSGGPGDGGSGHGPGGGGNGGHKHANRIAELSQTPADAQSSSRAEAEASRGKSEERRAKSEIGSLASGNGHDDQEHTDHHDAVATAVLEAGAFENAALVNGHALEGLSDHAQDSDAPVVEYHEVAVSTSSYQCNGVSHAAEHMEQVTTHWKLKCPECAGPLALQEGCVKCHGCGWAQC